MTRLKSFRKVYKPEFMVVILILGVIVVGSVFEGVRGGHRRRNATTYDLENMWRFTTFHGVALDTLVKTKDRFERRVH